MQVSPLTQIKKMLLLSRFFIFQLIIRLDYYLAIVDVIRLDYYLA